MHTHSLCNTYRDPLVASSSTMESTTFPLRKKVPFGLETSKHGKTIQMLAHEYTRLQAQPKKAAKTGWSQYMAAANRTCRSRRERVVRAIVTRDTRIMHSCNKQANDVAQHELTNKHCHKLPSQCKEVLR